MSNGSIEQKEKDHYSAKLMAIEKNADPSLIEPFLEEYQGKFLVDPENLMVYFIYGTGKASYRGVMRLKDYDSSDQLTKKTFPTEIKEYDGVTALGWFLTGPSKEYPDEQIYQSGGEKDSYLAGSFHLWP